MKKTAKILIIIAVAMMAFGVVVCGVTFAIAGFDYTKIVVGNEDLQEETLVTEVADDATLIIADLSSVSSIYRVEVVPSTDDKVHVTYNSRRGEKLRLVANGATVTLTPAVKGDWRYHIGIFQITQSTLTVAIPDDVVNVETAAAAADIRCRDLTLAGSLSIKVNATKAEFDNCRVNGDVTIFADAGDVALNGLTAATVTVNGEASRQRLVDVAATDVSLHSDFGDIYFNGLDVANSLWVSVDFGKVTGSVVGKAEDFTVVSTMEAGKNSLRDSLTRGPKLIEIHGDTGVIDVTFSGGDGRPFNGDGLYVDPY